MTELDDSTTLASPSDDTNGTDATLDGIGYGAALAELESILAELEDDTLDVDVLADRVARASVLIRFCRERISSARTQVEQIVADLDHLAADTDHDET